MEALGDTPSKWSLHIFEPRSTETGEQYARQRLVMQEIFSHLKQKRRSLLRASTEDRDRETTLVQILMTSADAGFISIAPPKDRHALGSTLVPFAAGYIDIPDDPAPPSRAFKKLMEAHTLFTLNFRRGDHCVDLGAAPGGWTHFLIKHGCVVTAVDRSPLDPRLMRSKQLSFTRGNALTWLPEKRVDWLVCDVITSPDRTAALLSNWLSRSLCHNFCVTIKFKGDPDLTTLASIRELLGRYCVRWDGKQLTHNKNEVTVVGEVR